MGIIKAYVVPHPPMIVPEVGKGEEKIVKKTIDSYEEIAKEISMIKPDTIIITSPHSSGFSDYFHISYDDNVTGTLSNFGASEISFNEEYDKELIDEIDKICSENNFPAGIKGRVDNLLDHGTMVPLYFIEKEYKDFKLIRIALSNLSNEMHYKFGTLIKVAIEKLDRKVVFIGSGDLSHKLQEYGPYGFSEDGVIYDIKIIDTLSKADFLELMEYEESFLDKAAICGHKSFLIMAGSIDGKNVLTKFYSHEDVTGVGYGILSYKVLDSNKNRCFLDKYYEKERNKIKEKRNNADDYVKLAIDSVYSYIKDKKVLDINSISNDELINNKAGVFVSIHKFNELRGCIGTIYPMYDSIGEEIINNSISASTKDYRFDEVKEDELDYLDINVDVLMEPEKINSKNDLDIKKYGVIVSSGVKRGLLLPDIEGINSVDEQIEIAKRKASILDDEDISLERFEVIRHI